MITGLLLIKLGGSVVTFKEKRLSANHEAIESICNALKKIRMPTVIVHGGGSFGHYWSVKYNMHTRPAKYDPRGVSIVHQSMVTLNQIIVNAMTKHNLLPYSIMPNALTVRSKPSEEKLMELRIITHRKIIPVTFGDVVHAGSGKFSILSGDVLMTMLAKALKPSKVIFAVNVDGVYQDLKSDQIVSEIDDISFKSLELSKVKSDATGGMRRKLSEALKIAASGINVMMINGLKPGRIINAVAGDNFEGTMIRASSRSKLRYARHI
jgi:isopentenyl phosphate kinase